MNFFYLLIFFTNICFAQSKQFETLAKDFESAKQELMAKEESQRKIMSSLYQTNSKIKKIVKEKTLFVQQRLVIESSTRNLATKILSLESRVKEQKKLLRERLTVIYKLGGIGIARILFSSTNAAQLEKNLRILGVVAKQDLARIKEYSEDMQDLKYKKYHFLKKLAHLKNVEGKIFEQEQQFKIELEQKNKLLASIRQSKEYTIKKLNNLRRKTAEADEDVAVLDLLFRPSIYEKKGKLLQPIRGEIVKHFGVVIDPQYNVSWLQKGIVLESKLPTPVHTVFEGNVAFVGEVKGFGETIIIDHGDHYYSVYSYNKDINVKVGDEVKENQIIAKTSQLEDSRRYGIYFEIRHFSEPYDPTTWLKGNHYD